MRWAQGWVCVEPHHHPSGGPAGPGGNREAVFLLTGKQTPCVWQDSQGLRLEAWSQQVCPPQPCGAPASLPCLGSPSRGWGGGPKGPTHGWGYQRRPCGAQGGQGPEETLHPGLGQPPQPGTAGGLPARSQGGSTPALPTHPHLLVSLQPRAQAGAVPGTQHPLGWAPSQSPSLVTAPKAPGTPRHVQKAVLRPMSSAGVGGACGRSDMGGPEPITGTPGTRRPHTSWDRTVSSHPAGCPR